MTLLHNVNEVKIFSRDPKNVFFFLLFFFTTVSKTETILKVPYSDHLLLFIFHPGTSGMQFSVINYPQKVFTPPEDCIFSPLFTACCGFS